MRRVEQELPCLTEGESPVKRALPDIMNIHSDFLQMVQTLC
jgi:hypothetical protein